MSEWWKIVVLFAVPVLGVVGLFVVMAFVKDENPDYPQEYGPWSGR